MHRRRFLYLAAGALAFPNLVRADSGLKTVRTPQDSKSGNTTLFITGAKVKPGQIDYKTKTALPTTGSFHFYDMERKRLETTYSKINIHKFFQHPHTPQVVAGAGMWTKEGLVYDVARKMVVQKLYSPKGYKFGGFGFFTSNGQALFLTALRETDNASFLAVYNTKTWLPEAVIETRGYQIREVFPLKVGWIVCCHAAATPAGTSALVTVLNMKDLKVQKEFPVPHLSCAVMLSESSMAFAGTKGKLTELYTLDLMKGAVLKASSALNYPPKGLVGFPAGIVQVEGSVVGLGVGREPKDSSVVIWDLRTRQIEVTPLGGQLLIGAGSWKNEMFFVNDLGQTASWKQTKLSKGKYVRSFDRISGIGRAREVTVIELPSVLMGSK